MTLIFPKIDPEIPMLQEETRCKPTPTKPDYRQVGGEAGSLHLLL